MTAPVAVAALACLALFVSAGAPPGAGALVHTLNRGGAGGAPGRKDLANLYLRGGCEDSAAVSTMSTENGLGEADASDGIGAALVAGSSMDAVEARLAKLQDPKVPIPLQTQSSFSGFFPPSPRVQLPGYDAVTLEHFHAERVAFDEHGKLLAENTYRWRDRLVRVVLDQGGRNQLLEDVPTGAVIYEYAQRQRAHLRGHTDVFIDEFALERVPTAQRGVYAWRDRTVRVVTAAGRLERIVDTEDESLVYLFGDGDEETWHLNDDAFDAEYHQLDRPAATARLWRLCELASKGAAPFGRVHVVWPNKGPNGKERLRHGGTVIWLHGLGGGAAMEQLAGNLTAQLAMPWVKFIFPSAPVQPSTLLGGATAASWFDVTRLDEAGVTERSDELKRSADFVAQLVQDEITHGTAPHELLVCGFGQGAAVALDVALRGYTWQPPPDDDEDEWDSDDPDAPTTFSAVADRQEMIADKRAGKQQRFLAAAAQGLPLLENPPEMAKIGGLALLSGWYPDSLVDLDPAWAGDLKSTYWMGAKSGKRGGVETFVAHGRADRTVPLALGKLLFKRARKVGFSVSKLLKYPHGHGLSRPELLDLGYWIDRQIPDPDWHISDYLGAVSASSQEYNHRGAIESGILPS